VLIHREPLLIALKSIQLLHYIGLLSCMLCLSRCVAYCASHQQDLKMCRAGSSRNVGVRHTEVKPLLAGMDVVFHCAAAAPSASNAIGNEKLMHDVNVLGTEHVIAACRALGVGRLVYTSSASVVFEGRDLLNVDESIPLAQKPMDFYTSTKVMAAGLGPLPLPAELAEVTARE